MFVIRNLLIIKVIDGSSIMTKSPVRIVIVDSGVSDANVSGCYIRGDDGKLGVLPVVGDEIGHGTAIYGIIHRHCPTAQFYSVKICKNDDKPHVSALIFALQYIRDNIDCDIVNLSLTVSCSNYHDYIAPLKRICDELRAKGIIIVAAMDNSGALSFPAVFRNVISVISGEFCFKTDDIEIIEDENELISVAGFGRPQSVISLNGGHIVGSGNSLACAHVSGIIAKRINVIEESRDIASVISVLNNINMALR